MWHQGFNRNFTKLREYFLYAKKTTLFNSSSPLCQRSAIFKKIRWTETAYAAYEAADTSSFIYLRFDLNENSASGMRLTEESVRSFHPADILQNGTRVTQRRLIWIKSFFFFSFAHKIYSCTFVKLRLNPWYHMDYFTDLLATFLDLDRVRTLAVYGGSESAQIS